MILPVRLLLTAARHGPAGTPLGRFLTHPAQILGQLAACNRLHEAEERLARWFLMVRDRMESDNFYLPQEFLAVMLGGIGTFEGTVAGGAAIGVMSAALPWAVAPVLADVLVFVIAIVVVKVRPEGLIAGRRG